ncbi:hypothetical protein EYF80_008159 [Liparis tanakae]|uniref:Uncharacterized protein n=1 Tax=Liparis tanakae TaxID=230148 RepID=A0A4Z2IWS8_9TELE|nr:hypothetical protein EYF80_008159 [Liparis tanakae]
MRRVLVVVGGVRQRRVEMPLPAPLPSARRRRPLRPLGRPSLSGQTGLVGGRPVGLRDDDAGVVEEGPGAEAVVVHRLGVGLQVALHVLGVEGEVGAQHGRQGGGGGVGQVGRRGHGERRGERRGEEAGAPRPGQRGHGEGRQGVRVDAVPRVAGARVPHGVPRSPVHAEQGFMRQAGMDETSVPYSSSWSSAAAAHAPLSPILSRPDLTEVPSLQSLTEPRAMRRATELNMPPGLRRSSLGERTSEGVEGGKRKWLPAPGSSFKLPRFHGFCPQHKAPLVLTFVRLRLFTSTSTLRNLHIPLCQPSLTEGDGAKERERDKEHDGNKEGVFVREIMGSCDGRHQSRRRLSLPTRPLAVERRTQPDCSRSWRLHTRLLSERPAALPFLQQRLLAQVKGDTHKGHGGEERRGEERRGEERRGEEGRGARRRAETGRKSSAIKTTTRPPSNEPMTGKSTGGEGEKTN